MTLDKYVIVDADRTAGFCNWVQRFSPEALASELGRAGLEMASVLGDVTGRPFEPGSPQFAVIARRR